MFEEGNHRGNKSPARLPTLYWSRNGPPPQGKQAPSRKIRRAYTCERAHAISPLAQVCGGWMESADCRMTEWCAAWWTTAWRLLLEGQQEKMFVGKFTKNLLALMGKLLKHFQFKISLHTGVKFSQALSLLMWFHGAQVWVNLAPTYPCKIYKVERIKPASSQAWQNNLSWSSCVIPLWGLRRPRGESSCNLGTTYLNNPVFATFKRHTAATYQL